MKSNKQRKQTLRRPFTKRGVFFRWLAACISVSVFLVTDSRAQQGASANHFELYDLYSGVHSRPSDSRTRIAYEASVKSPGAVWMRLLFSEIDLGRASHVSVHSDLDGDFIVLDAEAMQDYGNSTCYLNGDLLHLQLHVAPGDNGVFFRLSRLHVGDPVPIYSQCGAADNRVSSNDNRVGRIMAVGCTAWRATNGSFMTAGHCVDFDPDAVPGGNCGPGLPDGILNIQAGDFVGFNIPQSWLNGTPRAVDADDQYPIDLTSVAFRFDGCGQGLGKDWAVFGVNRNANTLLMPHEAYGLPMRVTNDLPLPGVPTTFRITGCGTDAGTANRTLQTDTGPYNGESTGNAPADILVSYQVDTMPASSGSPIMWNALDLAVGIHTTGGCSTTQPFGNNSGTSFEVDALETAIRDFTGTNAVFCDSGHPVILNGVCPCNGTVMRPFDSVVDGVSLVSPGGIVSIVAGNYPASNGNAFTTTKAQTWEAPCGTVVIGN